MDLFSVDSPTLLVFLGILYVVVFGLLSMFRREGLSVQFAVEAMGVTILAAALNVLMGIHINPALFLLVLYLITMRVRIVVEFANFFAKSGRFSHAERLYSLGELMLPDRTNQLILRINQGTLRLQQGALDESIAIFNEILHNASHGFLGVKYEAAAHYNLGVAYKRKNMESKAAVEFNAVLDTWPVSEYGRRAGIALEKSRQKDKP